MARLVYGQKAKKSAQKRYIYSLVKYKILFRLSLSINLIWGVEANQGDIIEFINKLISFI